MDSDLSAEIARIEAELAQDAAMRQQAQPQQQQQQQHPPASMFGFGQTAPAAPPPQQQQQQSPPQQPQHTNPFNVNATPFMPTPQQQPDFTQQQQQQFHAPQQQQQQQQQFMSGAGQAAAASAGMHSFSKDTDSRSIFIGNLPRGTDGAATTTPEELVQFFADCGSILNCTVLKDRATGELKGTAYIEFSDYTAMGKAIDTKNNANFKGSPLIVCVTHKRSNFKPARGGRGAARGRGRGGAEPLQALAAFMTMIGAASGFRARGGRGSGSRGGGGGGGVRGGGNVGGGGRGGAPKPQGGGAPGGFQPYQ